jgi:LmbE family N-acetylglucosaminyl deacetylase
MDVLYLSPHLDDAALSCGGLIHKQVRAGLSVAALTVFAGSPRTDIRSPFARELETRWGARGDAIAMRREEDVEALAVLGAAHIHLTHEDAIYRLDEVFGAPVYAARGPIFGKVRPRDPVKARALAAEIGKCWEELGKPRLYAMLSAGHHVDHQVVQVAVLHLLKRQSLEVIWYEDYPYAGDQEAVQDALKTLPFRGLRLETAALSDENLAAKLDSIACYRSQIPIFWRDEADMRLRVREHASRVGGSQPGEHYWHAETS